MTISAMIIPAITLIIAAAGLYKKVDIFSEFTAGAAENLKVCADILPSLIALVTAVGMLTACGAMEAITSIAAGFFDKTGFPSECLPLALVRPVSGSGAVAVYESILSENHPDSFAGKVAGVMLGSTETTFYTLAVYFGAVKIKKTRHTLAAALSGDITGFIFSVLTVNLLLGR